MNTPPTILV